MIMFQTEIKKKVSFPDGVFLPNLMINLFFKYVTEQLLCVIKAVSHMDIHKSPALEILVMLRWMQS